MLSTVFVAALALQAPTTPRPARPASPPPATLIARALQAMGGADALRDLAPVTTDFYNVGFGLGQEETPSSPARATVTVGRNVTDWRTGSRMQTVETRQVSGNVMQQRRVTAGGIGMAQTGTNPPQADPPGVVANVERAVRAVPSQLVLQAANNPTALTPLAPRTWRGEPHDGVRYVNGPDTLNLFFDRSSGLPAVVERVTDDPILGDRHTATVYTRWVPLGPGGVLWPRQIDVLVNDRLQGHTVVTAAGIGPVADSVFAIPDSIAARAQRAPDAPAPVAVNLVELAPGVWRAEGGTHFSLVVEQPTQLVVVEAPQSTARIQAVLDTLRARFPRKPVGLVVNTHHHWDHAGGLRGAMAAGIPVLTHRRNLEFVRGIAAARKTVAADALSRRARTATIRAVDDSLMIGSGDTRVVIYRLPTVHAEGMLAAYVPAARVLFTSDVLTPGQNLAPVGSAEVAALARARGIAVERVVGGHGGIASWPDVERAAGN
jgi:glyoxylase-like metal-dependent hydrolase (beta-lactamase superfamily II)